MRYLLLGSCLLVLLSCRSVYNGLEPATGDIRELQKFRPVFTTALYNAQIDVVGRHLSGLLLIKQMPDSSIRMVFSNEMGFKYFDFEFSGRDGFQVFYIMKQMDKKAVVKTLCNDMELILMRHLDGAGSYVRKGDQGMYYVFPRGKGFYCYITDTAGAQLVRMERSSKRKPVVEAVMKNFRNGVPDTIGIAHHNFPFTIGLKRIEK